MTITTVPSALSNTARVNQSPTMGGWMGYVEQGLTDTDTQLTNINNTIAATKPFEPLNCTFSASVGSNILTIALKTNAGNDPSSTDFITVPFRSATATTGTPDVVTITSALSIATVNGASQGTQNSTPYRLWVLLFNNGGTPVLALYQTVTFLTENSVIKPQNIAPLVIDGLASTTAMSAGATSAGVFYTPAGTTLTNKAYRIVGYVEFSGGQVTAGTYLTAPSKAQMYGPGVKLPGDLIQYALGKVNTYQTSNVTIPNGGATINTNTQGTQVISKSIVPSAGCNAIKLAAALPYTASDVTPYNATICTDQQSNVLSTVSFNPSVNSQFPGYMEDTILASITTTVTFSLRIGPAVAGNSFVNGRGGALQYGGGCLTTLRIEEIMV